MDALEAIRRRHSIRGFKSDPVPREIIAGILEIATHAPSPRNAQPWGIFVVAGETLDQLRWENVAQRQSGGRLNPEVSHQIFQSHLRRRQQELARLIFQLMGIKRGDDAALAVWQERGYRYFDAPVAIILCADKDLDRHYAWFALGCLAQNICLVAQDFGMGTCIHDQGVTYIEAIKKWVPVLDNQSVAMAISLGYPDPAFPANAVVAPREPLDGIVRWVGF